MNEWDNDDSDKLQALYDGHKKKDNFFHNYLLIYLTLRIASIFNDYFSSIAEKTKGNIKFSNKSFQDFLHHPSEESLFKTPTDAH